MAKTNSFLQVIGITKSFGDLLLFKDISFGIMEGQRVAIIAKNGTGKSTLLNIIMGEEDYQDGSVVFRKGLRVSYLKQEPDFDLEMTVLQACFRADSEILKVISAYEECLFKIEHGDAQAEEKSAKLFDLMELHKAWNHEVRIKQILSKLKINNFDQKIKELSGGQVKRIALANALIKDPEMLILDEPTNHLDLEMIEWLEKYFNRNNITLLMVTHDRYFLDRVCDNILEIDDQTIYSYAGNYSYYLEMYEERKSVFNANLDRAKNLYRTELDWIRRQPQARGTKARYRVEAFDSLKDKVSQTKKEGVVSLNVKSSYLGKKIFEAKYVSKSYGDLNLINNFYYNFARFEKVGIVGKNGTGKSTFLKMLLGEVKPDSGSFDIGETVKFAYYSQKGMEYDNNIKVIDVIKNVAEEIDLGDGNKLSASNFLKHFLFSPDKQNSYVYKLSGGERRRLYLCSVLMRNPNFLVLDEPTNDLDILTLNILEDYLKSFQGCVIVVSHDRYFMDKIVDHLFVFKGNGIIKDFPGNYTQYREEKESLEAKNKKNKENKENISEPTALDLYRSESKEKREKKLTYKEQIELKTIEKDMELLEKNKLEFEKILSSGTATAEEIQDIAKKLSLVNDTLEEKESRWLELSII